VDAQGAVGAGRSGQGLSDVAFRGVAKASLSGHAVVLEFELDFTVVVIAVNGQHHLGSVALVAHRDSPQVHIHTRFPILRVTAGVEHPGPLGITEGLDRVLTRVFEATLNFRKQAGVLCLIRPPLRWVTFVVVEVVGTKQVGRRGQRDGEVVGVDVLAFGDDDVFRGAQQENLQAGLRPHRPAAGKGVEAVEGRPLVTIGGAVGIELGRQGAGRGVPGDAHGAVHTGGGMVGLVAVAPDVDAVEVVELWVLAG